MLSCWGTSLGDGALTSGDGARAPALATDLGIGVVLVVNFCHLNTFPGKILEMTKHTSLIYEIFS